MQITPEKIAELRRLLDEIDMTASELSYSIVDCGDDVEAVYISDIIDDSQWEAMKSVISTLPALLDRIEELERLNAALEIFSENQVRVGLQLQEKLREALGKNGGGA